MSDQPIPVEASNEQSRFGAWLTGLCWRLVDGVVRVWSGWPSRHALALIVVLALALRLPLVAIPALHHPDEIFQYLEPAHRLATGYGVATWEWREGIRSWFLPLLLSGPIALSEKLSPDSLAYLPVLRGLFAVASISVVLSFYSLGNGISRFHGLLAAFVAAIWFDFVFYAVHTLSEPLALALIMPAAAVLCRTDTATPRKLAAAGFALGLAVIIRYQFLPAIGVLVLLTCKYRFRDLWLPVAIGGIAALLVGSAVDLSFGVMPFEWVFNNFSSNLLQGRSEDFGVRIPLFYPYYLITFSWQSSAWVILGFAALAMRRYPALIAAALVNVLLHSLIGHKEFRFVLLSTAIVVLFFSLGLADALRYVGDRMPARWRHALIIVAVLWVVGMSASLAGGERRRYEWTFANGRLLAMQTANRIGGLCGLASIDLDPWGLGGYTYLNRRVPMYLYRTMSEAPVLRRDSRSFNVIIAPAKASRLLPAEYTRGKCFYSGNRSIPTENDKREPDTIKCVFQRPGTCTPGATEINQRLTDLNI
ncbi:MAG TPA: hypothetical protein VF481_11385 [Novosphingobium sp.]